MKFDRVLLLILSSLLFCLFSYDIAYSSNSTSNKKIIKIFNVYSYEFNNICGAPQRNGFLKALSKVDSNKYHLDINHFYMDTKIRNTTPRSMKISAGKAIELIKDKKPDYIFITDDDAFLHVGLPMSMLGYKIIASGLNRYIDIYKKGPIPGNYNNIYAVEEHTELDKLFKFIDDTQYDANRYIIIGDDTTTSDILEELVSEQLKAKGISSFEVVNVETVFHIRTLFEHLNKQTKKYVVILCLQRTINDIGERVDKDYIIREVIGPNGNRKHLEVGFNSQFSKMGLLLTCGIDFYDMGFMAGEFLSEAINKGKFVSGVVRSKSDLYGNLKRSSALGIEPLFSRTLGSMRKVY